MFRIIAITGCKRSGKDATAEFLKNKGYENVKVAGVLKDVVKTLFQMDHSQVEGDFKEVVDERWGITPRQAMQFIGTEVMQYKIQELMPHIGRRFWINNLCKYIQQKPDKIFAISDIRFPHEVEELKKHFGNQVFVLKLIRSEHSDMYTHDDHSSEKEWLHISADATIENNGSIDELYMEIKDLFKM